MKRNTVLAAMLMYALFALFMAFLFIPEAAGQTPDEMAQIEASIGTIETYDLEYHVFMGNGGYMKWIKHPDTPQVQGFVVYQGKFLQGVYMGLGRICVTYVPSRHEGKPVLSGRVMPCTAFDHYREITNQAIAKQKTRALEKID